jgi:hypothetical protein
VIVRADGVFVAGFDDQSLERFDGFDDRLRLVFGMVLSDCGEVLSDDGEVLSDCGKN